MTISVRLSDKDAKLFKAYADINGISMSELIRSSVLERIEDEYDIKIYEEAMKEYLSDPKTYSMDEVEKELGL